MKRLDEKIPIDDSGLWMEEVGGRRRVIRGQGLGVGEEVTLLSLDSFLPFRIWCLKFRASPAAGGLLIRNVVNIGKNRPGWLVGKITDGRRLNRVAEESNRGDAKVAERHAETRPRDPVLRPPSSVLRPPSSVLCPLSSALCPLPAHWARTRIKSVELVSWAAGTVTVISSTGLPLSVLVVVGVKGAQPPKVVEYS